MESQGLKEQLIKREMETKIEGQDDENNENVIFLDSDDDKEEEPKKLRVLPKREGRRIPKIN